MNAKHFLFVIITIASSSVALAQGVNETHGGNRADAIEIENRIRILDPHLKGEALANISRFADDLFAQEDYFNALTMYKYVLGRTKEPAAEETLRFKMALCYEMGERWSDAEKAFGEYITRYPTSPKSPEASYRIGQGYFRGGDFLKATNFFNETAKNFEKSAYAPMAQYSLGLSRLKMGQWDLSKQEMHQFLNSFPEHSLSEKAKIVLEATEHSDRVPHKSEFLAGALSIIPGLGKAYTHHWGGAVIAMLVNGGLGFVIYDSFDHDRVAVGAVFSTLAAATYSANILGGYRSAKRYNQQRQEEYANEVIQKGYAPELELK